MGGRPVGYLHNAVGELNSELPRTNPDSSRVENLNQGPPDFKSSALNHSTTLPPSFAQVMKSSHHLSHDRASKGHGSIPGLMSQTDSRRIKSL